MNEYLQVGSTSPSYDPNGNLLYNGDDATYTWNINNRLLTVAKANGDTGSYRYDPLGRRVARRASIASVTTETYYLHNGWNVELEHDGTRYTHRRSWGLDLSGSLQGAGGVGGLIMTEHLDASGNASHNYYPSYDGNGNITALIDHQGNLAATWRYDAYGNTLATTGDPSLENYRFSTKPYDELTGFYYYGYRYYDPVTGRWPSRDPIEEEGGINLYGMVGNDSANRVDVLGLLEWREVFGTIKEKTCSTPKGCVIHEEKPLNDISQVVSVDEGWTYTPWKNIFSWGTPSVHGWGISATLWQRFGVRQESEYFVWYNQTKYVYRKKIGYFWCPCGWCTEVKEAGRIKLGTAIIGHDNQKELTSSLSGSPLPPSP